MVIQSQKAGDFVGDLENRTHNVSSDSIGALSGLVRLKPKNLIAIVKRTFGKDIMVTGEEESGDEFELPDYPTRREQFYREAEMDGNKEIIEIGEENFEIPEAPPKGLKYALFWSLQKVIEYKQNLHYPIQRLLIRKDILYLHLQGWITEKSILSSPIKSWKGVERWCNLKVDSVTSYRCASQPEDVRERLCKEATECRYRQDGSGCLLRRYLYERQGYFSGLNLLKEVVHRVL